MNGLYRNKDGKGGGLIGRSGDEMKELGGNEMSGEGMKNGMRS